MELTVATVLIAFAGVFLICFMKGGAAGGLLAPFLDPRMSTFGSACPSAIGSKMSCHRRLSRSNQ
jgi:hypothetical protein